MGRLIYLLCDGAQGAASMGVRMRTHATAATHHSKSSSSAAHCIICSSLLLDRLSTRRLATGAYRSMRRDVQL